MNFPFFRRSSAPEGSPKKDALSRGTILLCEDEPFYRQAITTLLESENYAVVSPADPSEAMSVLTQGAFKLILSAVEFGGATGGFKLIVQAKARPGIRNIPFIFLTHVADISTMERGTELGAVDYVIKSNTGLPRLKELLRRYLGD